MWEVLEKCTWNDPMGHFPATLCRGFLCRVIELYSWRTRTPHSMWACESVCLLVCIHVCLCVFGSVHLSTYPLRLVHQWLVAHCLAPVSLKAWEKCRVSCGQTGNYATEANLQPVLVDQSIWMCEFYQQVHCFVVLLSKTFSWPQMTSNYDPENLDDGSSILALEEQCCCDGLYYFVPDNGRRMDPPRHRALPEVPPGL